MASELKTRLAAVIPNASVHQTALQQAALQQVVQLSARTGLSGDGCARWVGHIGIIDKDRELPVPCLIPFPDIHITRSGSDGLATALWRQH
jgi:hypothetical protein